MVSVFNWVSLYSSPSGAADLQSSEVRSLRSSHVSIINASPQNVTELRLSDNPAWEGDRGNTKGDKHDDLQRARFICPVVGLEMNGRHR